MSLAQRSLTARIREAERVIDASGVVSKIEAAISAKAKRSGRPRELSVRTRLVGLLVVAEDGRVHLSRVVGLLNSLNAATAKRLGVQRANGITMRQVQHLFEVVTKALAGASEESATGSVVVGSVSGEGDAEAGGDDEQPTEGDEEKGEVAGRDDDRDVEIEEEEKVEEKVEEEGGEGEGDDDPSVAQQPRRVLDYTLFDEICAALVAASAHPETDRSRSVAVDGTSVDSWGTRRREEKDGFGGVVKVMVATDEDARWRPKGEASWKRPVFGYDLTVAASTKDLSGPDVPLAALSMRFRPANEDARQQALTTVSELYRRRGALGDVLVDREYTMSKDGADFLMPVRAMGGEPVFDLTGYQLGARGTQRGAIIIDGQPFSPSTPQALLMITPPEVTASVTELINYQRQIAIRAKYALVRHGSRKSDAQQTYQCPGSAGRLGCALQAPRRKAKLGLMPALLAPKTALPNSVCSKMFTTFSAEEIPHSQRELYGSREWYASYSRRNRVEGLFGVAKNEAGENLRRGNIRVRGLFKTGLLVALILSSTNLRLGRSFAKAAAAKVRAKRGRPVSRKMAKFKLAAASANAPPPTV